MKTFLEFIKEEWVKDAEIKYGSSWKDDNTVSIFKNPGTSDFVKLNKSGLDRGAVRFIAIAQGKVLYCWNAANATHYDIITHLAGSNLIPKGLENKNDECLKGFSRLSGGRLAFSRESESEYHADRNVVLDDDVVESILANEFVDKRFLPPPWTNVKSIREAAPQMMTKFAFIDRYVDNYMQNTLWSMIVNQSDEDEE